MIFDKIENADKYSLANAEGWAKAVELMKNFDPSQFVKGKTPCDFGITLGGLEYETRPREAAKPEAHKKYIDLMFMAEGEEAVLYAPVASYGAPATPYTEKGDCALYDQTGTEAVLHLDTGTFAVFLPSDAHAAGIALGAPATVRRIVIKIPVE